MFALRTFEPILRIEHGVAVLAWTTRWHPLGKDALPEAAVTALSELRATLRSLL
jgi:hypothetical protein